MEAEARLSGEALAEQAYGITDVVTKLRNFYSWNFLSMNTVWNVEFEESVY